MTMYIIIACCILVPLGLLSIPFIKSYRIRKKTKRRRGTNKGRRRANNRIKIPNGKRENQSLRRRDKRRNEK